MSLATVSAVVVGAAGIVAAQGQAAPPRYNGPTACSKHERFEHPQLKHGVLTIEGTSGDDTIVLRLQAGRPDVLQVDVGDARKHPFHFKRDDVDSIYLDAGDGNDAVSVDEANGVFTDTIADDARRWRRERHPGRWLRSGDADRLRRQRLDRRQPGHR